MDRDHRRDRVRVFQVHLRAEAVTGIDKRELVAARFVHPRTPAAAGGWRPLIPEREV